MNAFYSPGNNASIRLEAEINGVTHVLEGTARDVELDRKTNYDDTIWNDSFFKTYQDSQETVLSAKLVDGYTWRKVEKPNVPPTVAPNKFVTVTTNEVDGNQIRREFCADNFVSVDGQLFVTKGEEVVALFDTGRWFSVERTEKLLYG